MNNYELLEEIGRGAFATVFKAVDKRIHNIVAIKIVEKKNFSFFDKEINILSSLNSPYIVKYIEHFTSEEKLYIITEFIEGNDLLTHLNTKGCLNEIQAKKIFAQIVAGIYYLHSIKVMHRDLKMENIMITPDDDVKIIDFGLSVQTNKILFNTLCGSLAYCAPERLVGKPYSYSADIWAL